MVKLNQDQINESQRAARRLGLSFQDGQDPPAVAVPVNLPPGEICVGHTEVRTFQWLEGDGAYVHKSGGYFGLGGMAVVGTANLIGNTWRRVAAGREAAPQWRALDQGQLFVTTRRLAVRGEVRWTDIDFSAIRMVECEPGSLLLEIAETPRIMLEIPQADYWFVMLRKLVFRDIFVPPEPIITPVQSTLPGEPRVPVWAPRPPKLEIPTALVGDWIGARDKTRSLMLRIDNTFRLHLSGNDYSGPVNVAEGSLTFESPGLAGDYAWAVEGAVLTLTRPGSVSQYHRVVAPPPPTLTGEWMSTAGPRRILVIDHGGTYSLKTGDGETPGQFWIVDGTQLILQTVNLAPSLFTWEIKDDLLTMTRRDGDVSTYARPVAHVPTERPRYGDL